MVQKSGDLSKEGTLRRGYFFNFFFHKMYQRTKHGLPINQCPDNNLQLLSKKVRKKI